MNLSLLNSEVVEFRNIVIHFVHNGLNAKDMDKSNLKGGYNEED